MTERKADKRKEYFIAVIPPAPLFDEALKLKYYFSERYTTKAALKSPPHITLHMPFRWKEEKEENLTAALTQFSKHRVPFQVSFNNFGCFPPKVIFLDIKKSEQLQWLQQELLRFCRQTLNLFNANYRDRPFHPHLTVAFRDLKKAAFHEAWKEFKEKKFLDDFQVNHICLLKHDGKLWEIFQTFPLEGVDEDNR